MRPIIIVTVHDSGEVLDLWELLHRETEGFFEHVWELSPFLHDLWLIEQGCQELLFNRLVQLLLLQGNLDRVWTKTYKWEMVPTVQAFPDALDQGDSPLLEEDGVESLTKDKSDTSSVDIVMRQHFVDRAGEFTSLQ